MDSGFEFEKYLRYPVGVGICDLMLVEKISSVVPPTRQLKGPNSPDCVVRLDTDAGGPCSMSPILNLSFDVHPFFEMEDGISITQDDFNDGCKSPNSNCNEKIMTSEKSLYVEKFYPKSKESPISFIDQVPLSPESLSEKIEDPSCHQNETYIPYVSSPEYDMTLHAIERPSCDSSPEVDQLARLACGLVLTTRTSDGVVDDKEVGPIKAELTSLFSIWFQKVIRETNSKKCVITYEDLDNRPELIHETVQDSCRWMWKSSNGKRCSGDGSSRPLSSLLHLPPSAVTSGRERYRGGTLVVTSKKDLDSWEKAIRNIASAKLHLYTDTLAKRRKFGAYRVASYDFVLTTFDVLRSKEVVLPMDASDSSEEDEVGEDREVCGSTGGRGRGQTASGAHRRGAQWHQKRKPKADGKESLKEGLSNLHLISWDRVILDQASQNGIRRGTARGDSAGALIATSMFYVLHIEKDKVSYSSTAFRDIGNLMDIHSSQLDDIHCMIWA